MLTGKMLVKSYLTDAPENPGVYRFLDADDNILYIGKAKNLRKRLSQYALELNRKNTVMITLARSIKYNITESESAALILEAQLIKKFKPKFNIALKNDSSFPYIKLRTDHDYPQLLKFRGKNLVDGKFFGPFASASHVDVALNEIQKIFKLRSCTDNFFASRSRPCIQYQIKKCSAPCVNKISKNEYDDVITEVKNFLSGKNQELQKNLAIKMEQYSENLEFEKAAEIRDKIKSISYVQLKSQKVHGLIDADLIAIAEHNGEFCIELFLYRGGTPCGNQAYFPLNTSSDLNKEDVLADFIMQLYQSKIPPKQLILSHQLADAELYQQALYDLHNIKVQISTPKSGNKMDLIQNALDNAQLSLSNHLKISAKNLAALQEVQKLFKLPHPIERIEVYDNSHIQGSFAIGAMIVAGRNGFEKKEYRIFNIKNEENKPEFGGDDYAMLTEVLTRRLKRLKNEPDRRPDLMIIDGGKGHLSTIVKIMKEMNCDIPFVCMSKGVDRNSGREQFHCPGKEVFTLDKHDPTMKYLQILRDEVHNFAIKNHRNRRSSAIKISSLDQIPGIGAVKKKELLKYFGSFAAISEASEKDLQKVSGISKELAKIIYGFLR